jgi:hypothetical protein
VFSGCDAVPRRSTLALDGREMSRPDQKTRNISAMADIRTVARILRLWDPIGVAPGHGAPADEYDSYAPHIVSMVKGGCTIEELAGHLEHLAVLTIGLGPSSPSSQAHSLKFATLILADLRPSNIALERTRRE